MNLRGLGRSRISLVKCTCLWLASALSPEWQSLQSVAWPVWLERAVLRPIKTRALLLLLCLIMHACFPPRGQFAFAKLTFLKSSSMSSLHAKVLHTSTTYWIRKDPRSLCLYETVSGGKHTWKENIFSLVIVIVSY